MVADTKKCQTMINIMGQQVQNVRAAIATMKEVRSVFQAVNPNTSGTPLEGNVTLVNKALNALDDAVNTGTNGAVWDAMIAAIVLSHRNAALEG